jgi:hypothetical protein
MGQEQWLLTVALFLFNELSFHFIKYDFVYALIDAFRQYLFLHFLIISVPLLFPLAFNSLEWLVNSPQDLNWVLLKPTIWWHYLMNQFLQYIHLTHWIKDYNVLYIFIDNLTFIIDLTAPTSLIMIMPRMRVVLIMLLLEVPVLLLELLSLGWIKPSNDLCDINEFALHDLQ